MRGIRRPAPIFRPAPGILIVCALLGLSCGRSHRDAAHGFQRPAEAASLAAFYDSGTRIVDSLALPAYYHGADATLVTSRDTTDTTASAQRGSFDRMELFVRDSGTRMHAPVFVDAVDNGVSVAIEDVTGDDSHDIVVRTMAAATNDSVDAAGLSVYGFTAGGRFTLLFQSGDGAPEFVTIPGRSARGIRMWGVYSGRFPGVAPVTFVRSIHVFNGESYTPDDSLTDAAAAERLSDFFRALRALQKRKSLNPRELGQLYESAAGILLQSEVISRSVSPEALWSDMREFLKKQLPREQFEDLESLLNDAEDPMQETPAAPPASRATVVPSAAGRHGAGPSGASFPHSHS